MAEYIIIAPHADDEVIGCSECLRTGKVSTVLYGEQVPYTEISPVADLFKFSTNSVNSLHLFTNEKNKGKVTFLFPDPYFELHPEHRRLGAIGEALSRKGFDVLFYSTNMNAPYIREVKNPGEKRKLLEKLFPDKSSLWRFDHKYFLFEGTTKWIFSWQD